MEPITSPTQLRSLEAEGREIVERLGGEWRGSGGMCRCPAHDDRTPSLSVRSGTRQLLFHCFAGCETREILHALRALRLLAGDPVPGDREAVPTPADPGRRHRGAAARIWADARPVGGSPAEAYLQSRGLEPDAQDLRYHPNAPSGRGVQAIFRPAMLAAVRDDSGLVAIHRTFLEPGTARLADIAVPKRALGRLGCGAVRLNPPRDGTLGLAEGIETALAATRLTSVPCWATLGTERFGRVRLPAGVRRLILFLDHDEGGRRAERLARDACRDSGVDIEARIPEAPGADWNDVLMASAGSLRSRSLD